MKKILIFTICFLLSLPMTACNNESIRPNIPATSENVTDTTVQEEKDSVPDNIEFGLTINNTYYPIPISLKQLINDGWSISDQTPYFLHPMVGEDYYEVRTNFSLSKDGSGICAGGSIIRLLEKDGVLLEVTIANQADTEKDERYQKIEHGVVDSITVFYDEAHTSIKLNNKELSSLTPEILVENYPVSDGWTHSPSNYSNHPEFGVSTEYFIAKNLDNCNRNISIYFNLENTAFKISVLNQTHLN